MINKKRILFVCLGNICRSPAAEGILRKMISLKEADDRFFVDSAGTSGYHNGNLPDKRMRYHASMRGYNLNSRSRQIELEDFLNFDYIITMDDSNYNNVLRLAPDIPSRYKVHKMMEFSSNTRYDHIPDPYYQGSDGFELVLDLLENACETFLRQIDTEDSDNKTD